MINIDIISIVLFFILIFIVGIIYSTATDNSTDDYFVARRKVGWVITGLAVFAANTSSSTLLFVTGSTYKYGLVIMNYELTGIIACLCLAYVFGPIYVRNNVFTMPEFLEKRYNATCRIVVSLVSISNYIFTKISITILAGALLLEQITHLDIFTLSLTMIIVTGIYSVVGGQKPIIYTEAIQGLFIIISGLLVLFFICRETQGISDVLKSLPDSHNKLIMSLNDEDFPWPGVFVALPIVGIWFHCIDQELAQKFLSAKSVEKAKSATILHAYLKLLIPLIVTFPALAAINIFPDVESDHVYTNFITSIAPAGLKGLVIVGFVAALMSSLSASFNACTSLFTFDVYKKMYPGASNFALVNIGKLATITIVIFSMVWVVLINYIESDMFIFVTSAFSYITPPIVAVFLAAVFWKRANSKAALVTLVSGYIIGMFKLLLAILDHAGILTSGLLLDFARINYLYYTVIMFAVNVLTIVLMSLLTKKPSELQLEGTVIRLNTLRESGIGLRSKVNILASLLLVLIIITFYIIFS